MFCSPNALLYRKIPKCPKTFGQDCRNQMFTYVSLGRAQIWRPHTESYKFLLDILVNNSSAKNHTDLTLGQVGLYFCFLFFVCCFIFF